MKHSPILCHRLFFAVRPPPPIARQIAQSAVWFGPDAKGVRADHLHVTLAILDDHPDFPEQVAAKLIEIGATLVADSFEIVLDRVAGSHSSVALRPRRRIAALSLLHEALDRRLRSAGLAPRPGYSFNPHLTLFYRDGAPFSQAIDPIGWMVDEFALVHSLVGRTQHEVIGRWPLRGSASAQYGLFG